MRSRYSAYRLGLGEYLYQTWHPETRGELTPELLTESGLNSEWLSLEIVYSRGGPDDERGEVEFKARYKVQGRIQQLHERSLFLRSQGRWTYHSGQFSPPKIGKNTSCPCGSHKKYKQCCAQRRA
ncbi:YchJ family protein [Zobellella aerophila]|uniref:YchJ family protein n=2 Tax=Zobellella aerophila TaxID=870480 RepID=A0ABP6UZG8_9GAMM